MSQDMIFTFGPCQHVEPDRIYLLFRRSTKGPRVAEAVRGADADWLCPFLLGHMPLPLHSSPSELQMLKLQDAIPVTWPVSPPDLAQIRTPVETNHLFDAGLLTDHGFMHDQSGVYSRRLSLQPDVLDLTIKGRQLARLGATPGTEMAIKVRLVARRVRLVIDALAWEEEWPLDSIKAEAILVLAGIMPARRLVPTRLHDRVLAD